jgi:hypothetical protein
MAKKTQNKKKSSDKKETEATTASKWEKVAFLGVALFIVVVAIARVARVVVAYLGWGGSGVVKEKGQMRLEDNQLQNQDEDVSRTKHEWSKVKKHISNLKKKNNTFHPSEKEDNIRDLELPVQTEPQIKEIPNPPTFERGDTDDSWKKIRDPPTEFSSQPELQIKKWIQNIHKDIMSVRPDFGDTKPREKDNWVNTWTNYSLKMFELDNNVGLNYVKTQLESDYNQWLADE